MFIVGAPRDKYTAAECEALKTFVDNGHGLLVMLTEGGEPRLGVGVLGAMAVAAVKEAPGKSRSSLSSWSWTGWLRARSGSRVSMRALTGLHP